MAEIEKPRTQTKWTKPQIMGAIARAYQAETGIFPSRKVIAIFWAKFTLECGRDGQSCWNHNVGNVRGAYYAGGRGPDGHYVGEGTYCVLKAAWERRADGSIYFPDVQHFRAYPDFDAGTADCIGVLAHQSNFQKAWAVLTGLDPTPEAYVRAAKEGRYFTASLEEYMSAVVSLYNECMAKTAEADWPVELRDTDPAPGPDAITLPGTPTSKSSQKFKALTGVPIWDGVVPTETPQAVDFVAGLADSEKDDDG